MSRTGTDKQHNPHSHQYTIADDEAVDTLVSKMQKSGAGQVDRGKLREALDTAMEEYRETDEQGRKAFFHGMLTGYAVALKMRDACSAPKI